MNTKKLIGSTLLGTFLLLSPLTSMACNYDPDPFPDCPPGGCIQGFTSLSNYSGVSNVLASQYSLAINTGSSADSVRFTFNNPDTGGALYSQIQHLYFDKNIMNYLSLTAIYNDFNSNYAFNGVKFREDLNDFPDLDNMPSNFGAPDDFRLERNYDFSYSGIDNGEWLSVDFSLTGYNGVDTFDEFMHAFNALSVDPIAIRVGNINGNSCAYDSFLVTRNNCTDPVPEPATMLLFGTGLAGLAGLKRKRKK